MVVDEGIEKAECSDFGLGCRTQLARIAELSVLLDDFVDDFRRLRVSAAEVVITRLGLKRSPAITAPTMQPTMPMSRA